MAWQCLGRRRQAFFLRLLAALLFAVASLNFFIPWRLTTDERPFATEVDVSHDEATIVISAGHLDGTLYLPTALRPKKLTRNRNNHETEDDEWCCLIASSTKHQPSKTSCMSRNMLLALPSACTDTMYPHQSIKNKNSINKFDKSKLLCKGQGCRRDG
jgi:hypothetical protein